MHRVIFIFLFMFCSCTTDERKQPVTASLIKVYNENEFYSKIKIIDTICENDTRRAQSDIKKGKLSINLLYVFQRWNNKFKTREKNYAGLNIEKKIVPHLEKYNIKLDTNIILRSSIVQQYDHFFNEYCYEQKMREEIEKRFGVGFIDSLAKIVEREHVMNNKNQIFDLKDADVDDGLQGVRYSDFNTKCRIDFEHRFVYPANYKEKNEKTFSYTTANFILMKDGRIKDLVVEASFANPKNRQHKQHFENEVRKFVLQTKWVHPRYSGKTVNSNMDFTYWHK